MVQRGEHAAGDAERRGNRDAGDRQFDCPGQARQDFGGDGLAATDRCAQVEVQQAGKDRRVLGWSGLVEPELVADVLDLRLGRQQSGDDAGGVAWQESDHHEHDDRHSQQCRDSGDQATGDVVQHASARR